MSAAIINDILEPRTRPSSSRATTHPRAPRGHSAGTLVALKALRAKASD
jgi:hypothetical protein